VDCIAGEDGDQLLVKGVVPTPVNQLELALPPSHVYVAALANVPLLITAKPTASVASRRSRTPPQAFKDVENIDDSSIKVGESRNRV